MKESEYIQKYADGSKTLEKILQESIPQSVPNRDDVIARMRIDHEKNYGWEYAKGREETKKFSESVRDITTYLNVPDNFDQIVNKYDDNALINILVDTSDKSKGIRDIQKVIEAYKTNPEQSADLMKNIIIKEYSVKNGDNWGLQYALSNCSSETINYVISKIVQDKMNKFISEGYTITKKGKDGKEVKELDRDKVLNDVKGVVYSNDKYDPKKGMGFVEKYISLLK